MDNIPNEGNWRFIKQYESNGDLKFVKVDGSRSHAPKHEFKYGRKLGCRPRNVWNTEQGYNFGTKKFVNRSKNDLEDIKCFKSKLEWEKKYG